MDFRKSDRKTANALSLFVYGRIVSPSRKALEEMKNVMPI